MIVGCNDKPDKVQVSRTTQDVEIMYRILNVTYETEEHQQTETNETRVRIKSVPKQQRNV